MTSTPTTNTISLYRFLDKDAKVLKLYTDSAREVLLESLDEHERNVKKISFVFDRWSVTEEDVVSDFVMRSSAVEVVNFLRYYIAPKNKKPDKTILCRVQSDSACTQSELRDAIILTIRWLTKQGVTSTSVNNQKVSRVLVILTSMYFLTEETLNQN